MQTPFIDLNFHFGNMEMEISILLSSQWKGDQTPTTSLPRALHLKITKKFCISLTFVGFLNLNAIVSLDVTNSSQICEENAQMYNPATAVV